MHLSRKELTQLRDEMRPMFAPTINDILSYCGEYDRDDIDIEEYSYMEYYDAIYRKAYDLFIIS